jgi:hypothetical protein
MRECSRSLDTRSAAFTGYRDLLAQLREDFDVGIYNLNYDNVAVTAWPEAFTGFPDGKFDPRAVGTRREWDFIYHVHGSVHYSFCDPPFTRALEWRSLDRTDFVDCRDGNPELVSGFLPMQPTTLVAGGYKLDQLLADPAQTFHASLVRHAHEADAFLIVGYGFGDVHVNRALRNRFELSPYNPSGRPPVVVITRSGPGFEPTGYRQDLWTHELTHALNGRFPASGNRPLSELTAKRQLEPDLTRRIAIWHDGFLEVRPLLNTITAWLNG